MHPRPKLLILGTGWGGTSLLRTLRNNPKYDITIASTRDHMLFTPLLTSTATGALEHRSIIEPIRPLATQKGARFLNAHATRIESQSNRVYFQVPRFTFPMPDVVDSAAHTHTNFHQTYDALVISVGADVNTFGIPGVKDHCLFMKEARHARAVRKRMHDLFEAASLPVLNAHQRRSLLTFVVCGAGPTGVELTAEIGDWLRDMAWSKRYIDLVEQSRVVLVEASGNILSAFDQNLRSYALKRLRASRIEVKLGSAVKSVEQNAVVLEDSSTQSSSRLQERLPCGMVVWTAGVGPREVVATSDLPRDVRGCHIATDDYMLCRTSEGTAPVLAIGDCARIDGHALVPIAQVAEQQGIYVAGLLNKTEAMTQAALRATGEPFKFASKGMLAYVGSARGVAAVTTGSDRGSDGNARMVKSSGFVAWAIWRFAYFSKLGSFRNKLQVPLDWVKTALFGRDVSSF